MLIKNLFFFKYLIVNDHAPTEDIPDEEKEKFYVVLERIIQRTTRETI